MKLKSCTSKIKSAFSIIGALLTVACGNLDTLQPVGGDKAPATGSVQVGSSTGQGCEVTTVRYPTDAQDFPNLLYGHRGFLDAYQGMKHLAHDTVYTEGTAIHPIACGIIRYYGPASGYGTLVAVVEHRLANAMGVTNGDGSQTVVSTLLSIYGHQRKTQYASGGQTLAWKTGDTIQPDDVIGFVQSDSLNGDGPEHLHLGIRLQGASEAQAADDSWFRGNDTPGEGQYKRYFTDPKTFLPKLAAFLGVELDGEIPQGTGQVGNYPIGTLFYDAGDDRYWLVSDHGRITHVSAYGHLPWQCAVTVTPSVLACYSAMDRNDLTDRAKAQAIKFDGEPQVYQVVPAQGPSPVRYRIFLSYESFLSWGLRDNDILAYPLWQKSTLLATMENKGFVGFMPGALVKGWGQSEVAVADQQGLRRPIFDWNLFQAMGYKSGCVYDIDPTTLDVVAGPRSSQMLTLQEASQCATQGNANGPGGGQGPDDAGGSGGQSNGCVLGQQIACGCMGGVQGIQVCKEDGTYDVCQCPEAGAAGTGGSGGSGGIQGMGGQGGTGGSAPLTTDGGSSNGCIPGQQVGCGCLGGSQGHQVCAQDGQHFEACQCPEAGMVDAGGQGNSGGSSGSGGSGGSSGLGGNGGSAPLTTDGGASGSGGSVGSGPCYEKGAPGKTTFIVSAPITQSNVISVFGWIQYPNWSGLGTQGWSGWSWGQPATPELVFQKGEAYQGAKYIFAPGVSPATGQAQNAWYCEKDDCPVGTFIVCNGLQEACRFQNGVLSGGASYTPNPANWQNMQCVLP